MAPPEKSKTSGLRAKVQRERPPSKEKRDFYLFANRKVGPYPEYTERGGKWLIFEPSDTVDEVWRKIKLAVEKGGLGGMAKVSTAKPNPNAKNPSAHVICVYTYDIEDKPDIQRVRASLRDLGIIRKIPYKTDDATYQGKYAKAGDKRISSYYE